MSELASKNDLPADYIQQLDQQHLEPLWPMLRGFLPFEVPERKAQPCHWSYEAIRPLLLQAGELTPIEKAERRVLVLCNPGYDSQEARITPTLYSGLQLVQPGETAPNHKHTPAAVRLVIEGNGGYTVVEGEKLPMEAGDLILTPCDLWHEHGHDGDGPIIWQDVLDLPLVYSIEASYSTEGKAQQFDDSPDRSQTDFVQSGLLPYRELSKTPDYPLMRFPWQTARAALIKLAGSTEVGEPVQLAYVNPVTGAECLPTMGFSALMLRSGETLNLARRSASTILSTVEGQGTASIDAASYDFTKGDIMAVPTHANVSLRNGSNTAPAFLFVIDDAPLQRKMGIYEEFKS